MNTTTTATTQPEPTPGTLYLVPTPLDFGCETVTPIEDVLPQLTLQTAARLSHWISENAKSTRHFLNRVHAVVPLTTTLQDHHITELPRAAHKHGDHGAPKSAQFDAKQWLAPALQGTDMGLTSEAGMPAIADPGSSIVRAAHQAGIRVIPLVGPVSLLLSLAASGLNGQNFAFVGYVPQDPAARKTRLRQLEGIVHQDHQTQIMIETPYRNEHLMRALIETLNPSTYVCIASGLTLASATIQTAQVKDWRAKGWAINPKTPTVFAIGK